MKKLTSLIALLFPAMLYAQPVVVTVDSSSTQITDADAARVKLAVYDTIRSGDDEILGRFRTYYPPPQCAAAQPKRAETSGQCLRPEAIVQSLWWIHSAEIEIDPGGAVSVHATLSVFDELIIRPEAEASRDEASLDRSRRWRRDAREHRVEVSIEVLPGHRMAHRWAAIADDLTSVDGVPYVITINCSESPDSMLRDGRDPAEWSGAIVSLSSSGEVLYGASARRGVAHYAGRGCRANGGRVATLQDGEGESYVPSRGSNARMSLTRGLDGESPPVLSPWP